jgi:hypothetical protein
MTIPHPNVDTNEKEQQMFTTRPVLKRKPLVPKNDARVPAGRSGNTNQLKLSYLGRFRVSSPEPEVFTIDGESVVTSMRTEHFRRQPSAHRRGEGHLPLLSKTVRGQRR